jgi:hypothetical protein
LDKAGKLGLVFLMEQSVYQLYNGFVSLAKKVTIHLKDAANSFNRFMIVYELELEQYFNFIQMVKTNLK